MNGIQVSHHTKNGSKMESKTDNRISLVVPGVQATEHRTSAVGDRKLAQAVGDHD